MQRANETGNAKRFVEPVGLRERVRVDGDDGIDVGALLVMGVDPIEIALHQLVRRQPAGSEGHVNVVDGRLYDLERRAGGVLSVRRRHAQGQRTALPMASWPSIRPRR